MASLAFRRPAATPARGFAPAALHLSPEFVAAVHALGAEPAAVVEPVLEEHADLIYADTGFEWVSEHEIYQVPSAGDEDRYVDLVALSVLVVTSPDRRTTTVMLTNEFLAA